MTVVLACTIFVVTYALIATDRVHRVTAALGGVAAMAVVGVVDTRTAFYSRDSGVDWNVIFLLLGMMVIVGVLKQTGLFDYLAVWAAQRSEGRPFRLMALLIVVTAGASALLDNVTTVLLVAPVTLSICARLGLRPVPYLIVLAFASNIGGTATLIGDPPNIIIASRAGLSFNDFLLHLAPIVILILAAFVCLCWLMFRGRFEYDASRASAVMDLRPGDTITDRRLLGRCLVVLLLVTVGFSLHSAVHVQPSLIALLGAGTMVLISRTTPAQFLEEVEWPTLVFFMGLFVLVGGLVEVGVIDALGQAAIDATGDRFFLAATGLLFGSAVLGAFVDNIPYTATMAPIVEDLAQAAPTAEQGEALWWAFALGADFGGNTTAVAAGANVVIIGIAARHLHPISFWEFRKYGLVVTTFTLVLAWPYVWLRYFAFA
jgi:Na+/H+ antiporter NhaD/arsenite permease-like protein